MRLTIDTLLTMAALAATGGVVRFLSEIIKEESAYKHMTMYTIIFLALANAFISSFCGVIGALVASNITDDVTTLLSISGIFGYFGTRSMDIIMQNIKNKMFDKNI